MVVKHPCVAAFHAQSARALQESWRLIRSHVFWHPFGPNVHPAAAKHDAASAKAHTTVQVPPTFTHCVSRSQAAPGRRLGQFVTHWVDVGTHVQLVSKQHGFSEEYSELHRGTHTSCWYRQPALMQACAVDPATMHVATTPVVTATHDVPVKTQSGRTVQL